MDYSLYLAVENIHGQNSTIRSSLITKSRNIFISTNKKEAYHIGVIDFLQEWDWSKKRERFWKTKVMMKDAAKLSAIEPVAYQKRWI